jgi:hypothetical protein
MNYTKLTFVFCICIAAMLAGGETTELYSSNASSNDVSPAQILKMVQENYAAMTSYEDEGQIIRADDSTSPIVFTIRLARTNFYRIEWKQGSQSLSAAVSRRPQAVWSSGAGHFLEIGCGPQAQGNRRVSLTHAASNSKGAATSIPCVFFQMPGGALGNHSDDPSVSQTRLPDERLGAVDCYVLMREVQGQIKTLWIGKDDLLIHQIKTVTSAEAMRGMLTSAGAGFEIIEAVQRSGSLAFTSIEIHTNIVVNRRFSRSDFVPSFPSFNSS